VTAKLHTSNWRAWALSAACALTMGHARANGIAYDSSLRTTGNIWSPSQRFQLQKEHLTFRLGATTYDARVTYRVAERAAADGARRRAVMYFPVVCQYQHDGKSCVERFQAFINEQPVAARLVPAADIPKFAALRRLAQRLSHRLPVDIQSMEGDFASTYQFYEVPVPAATPIRELTMSYRAAYSQIQGDSNKSARIRFDKARLLYDFSPAAAWAGPGDKTLHIEVDTRGLQGHLSRSATPGAFVRNGDRWVLDIKNPDFTRMPPLMLSIDNGPYRNFTEEVQALELNKARYNASLPVASLASNARGNVRALTDRDPRTFWCWRGRDAAVDLQMDAVAIAPHPDGGWLPEPFEGVAILNGAARSRVTARRFGAANEVRVSLVDATAGTEAALGTYAMPYGPMRSDQDRFRSLGLLADPQWSDHLGQQGTDVFVDGGKGLYEADLTPADRPRIRQGVLRLHLRRTRSGNSDENCISEVYPLYNGG